MNTKELSMSIHIQVKRCLVVALLMLFFFSHQMYATGNKIKGSIANYTGDKVFLAMIYGGKQYVVDTAITDNGKFLFDSYYDLESGVYLVVLPPAKSFLLLIDRNIPEISFTADNKDVEGTIQFQASPDNTLYYKYLKFFQAKRNELDSIKSTYDTQKSEPDKAALLAKMQQLKKEVLLYQTELVQRNPGTLTAAIVKCELPVDVPAFDGAPEDIQMKKYLFQKAHYFDNIDLKDERLIRAPKNVLVDRVEYYLDNLTPQSPDSINTSVDYILDKCKQTQVTYRFLLTYMFNKYREAKKIGMDGVYVHIAENYIATGKAPWIEEEEKNKVLSAVKAISPTLIGKKAPNFTVQTEDDKNISLYDIQSPYTILIFWAPNCTHCQQSMPQLNTFYKAYKDKGVQVFAVCTKVNEQEKSCWDYIDKNQFTGWINGSDKNGGTSSIQTIYNVKTTPKIYVVDKDKKIIVKDIGVENLEEVFKRLFPTK